MSLSPTRTRRYDLRGLRSRRRVEEEEEAEDVDDEGEVENAERETRKVEGRRSNRLKRKKKSCMHVYSDEEEGRVRFDLEEDASSDDSEEEVEENEGKETRRRRSERLSQSTHTRKSFVVPDYPMDDDRDDGDYVGSEDEEEVRGSRKTDLRTRKDTGSDEEESDMEEEENGTEEENGDSLSVGKLLELAEKDASDLISHLITEEKVPILLLDEHESYSMLLAFAALRRSFEGLWCSRTDERDFQPLKLWERMEENYERSMGRHRECGYCRVGAPKGRWYTNLKQSLSELTQVELARFDLNFWAHQLKAASASACLPPTSLSSPTSTPQKLSSSSISTQFPTKYIWLNPSTSAKLAGKESTYVKKFLFDCASVQEEGGRVFVTLPPHAEGEVDMDVDVDVDGLVEMAGKLGYRHFADRSFIKDECVHNGFHGSNKEEREGWTTLIFVKVKTPEETPTKDDIVVDNAGLPTTLPRPRSTVVIEIDSQPLASSPLPPKPAPSSATAPRAQASTPQPSQPTSTIPSPPPSPLTSGSGSASRTVRSSASKSGRVRRSSRQHGPLLYGSYRDVPLAEDGDGDGEEEQQDGGQVKEKGSEGTKKARFWVDVPNSRASSSRGSTKSVTKRAANKGKGQTTLKGTFISQKKRTTAKPKSKRTLTHSLSALVSSPPSPSPSPSASTSTSKGKERERERERERVETTVTISSMVIGMGKGYRVGGGVAAGGVQQDRDLSPEYLPPSPPAKKRRLSDDTTHREGDVEEREEVEDGEGNEGQGQEMDVDPSPRPQNDINPEEEAQARDFLNFHDEDEEMPQDDPPLPSSSREYRPLKRLKRAGSFASGSGEGEGGGSVHSSHATLVDLEGSASPAVVHTSTVAGPASSSTAAATVTITTTATGSGLRRSRRQLEKETNIDRFNRGRSREEAIVVDTDSDEEGGDGDGGDDMDHDLEDVHQEEQPPLLPLHQFVDIEARDAGLTYPNVHRYGTEYGTRWVELVDVELE